MLLLQGLRAPDAAAGADDGRGGDGRRACQARDRGTGVRRFMYLPHPSLVPSTLFELSTKLSQRRQIHSIYATLKTPQRGHTDRTSYPKHHKQPPCFTMYDLESTIDIPGKCIVPKTEIPLKR